MEKIVIDEVTRLIEQGFTFTLVSRVRQNICNDPVGEYIVIKRGENAKLSSYSRNEDGSLCFQVNFERISVFYYPENANSYEYPFYIPDKEYTENLEDLFYIKEKQQRWRARR